MKYSLKLKSSQYNTLFPKYYKDFVIKNIFSKLTLGKRFDNSFNSLN